RLVAASRGAATVRRGEGVWFDAGRGFFAATTGGPFAKGQIFCLHLGGPAAKDRLELLAPGSDRHGMDMPDNITVAPWGDVVLAEDSVFGHQFLRLLSSDGGIWDFGRNARSSSELAGVCFSPDRKTLFVNLYGDGLTLGIRGPFAA